MGYTNRSEIVRVDELSRVTNGVVFGLEKRITKAPTSQTKADLWDNLKALAPPDCPSMQADIKNLYKKLQGNKNLKQKRYSKNANDWYTKSFVFVIAFYIGILAIFGNFWSNICLIHSSCWFYGHFFA